MKMVISTGDELPDIELYHDSHTKMGTHSVCKDKKIIIVGIVGAYTPNCSQTHYPGYIELADEIKGKGIQDILCIVVNDPYVARSWASANNADGKVSTFADPAAIFTKAIGMELDGDGFFTVMGNTRSKRYVLIVDNLTVTSVDVEVDQIGLSTTLAESVLVKL